MSQSADIDVLHVDDEPQFTDMAATFLERTDGGLSVETAASAGDGLTQLSETEFDCVVSDYDMPGLNGLEFLNTVREDHPDLPFILYTGKGSEEVASEAISAGVTDYLQKETGTDQYTVLANRIRNAATLREVERERDRHLDVIETAGSGISILDENGHYIYVNQSYADLYEYDPTDLHGEHWELVRTDESARDIRERVFPQIRQDGHWRGETISRRADGTEVVVSHQVRRTDRGKYINIVRDLTGEKDRKRQLRQKTARLEVLFEYSPDMINIHDMEGNLIEPNPRLCEKIGYDRSELKTMHVWDIDQKLEAAAAKKLWATMDTGDSRRVESVYQRSDGSTFPVEVHVRRFQCDNQDRFAVIAHDISDRHTLYNS